MGLIARGVEQEKWLAWLREGHCIITPNRPLYSSHPAMLSWENFTRRLRQHSTSEVLVEVPQVRGRPAVTHCFLMGAENICGGCRESIPRLVAERISGRPLAPPVFEALPDQIVDSNWR